jgi:Fur family transcriptional regulator, ferric uptake regulator
MTDRLQQLHMTLRQRGQRLTESRRLVFTALLDREPQTMSQLIAACPAIDRSSIYRTVVLFERLGIVQRLQIGWKYRLELTDAFNPHHHHLTCTHCGQVISFDESPQLEAELAKIIRTHDFQMQDHQLEIQGLCQSCAPLKSTKI